eukprot:scaffold156661_cov17-Tisochrysis_lutea.AAC.1
MHTNMDYLVPASGLATGQVGGSGIELFLNCTGHQVARKLTQSHGCISVFSEHGGFFPRRCP